MGAAAEVGTLPRDETGASICAGKLVGGSTRSEGRVASELSKAEEVVSYRGSRK